MENFKRKFYTGVLRHRKLIVAAFLVLTVICVFMKGQVGVNYDIKDYLPEDSVSTVALDVMEEEYEDGVPNARIMIEDLSIQEAAEYKEKIAAVDGVESVTWLDDSVNLNLPIDAMDRNLVEQYYKDGNALMQVSINKDKNLAAVNEIEEIIGQENAMTGNAISTAAATENTVKEVLMLTIIAVIMVLIILVFTMESWLEPFIIIAGIGVAVMINGGTNLIFGQISFVTNAAGSVLQLAVSLDYSVFLLHRFHECRKELGDPDASMLEALCRSTNSIFSSGMTTIIGFLALVFMRFLLGPDIGLALAKGIIISLITVFVFLPAGYMMIYRVVEKTKHKPLLPDFTKFGKFVAKIMIPMVCVFALTIVPAFMASNANDYYYGSSKMLDSNTEYGQDTDRINEIYGQTDTYALLLPKGEVALEKAVSEDLQQLPQISSVVSYVDTVGAEIPADYLSEDMLSQLNSENYTRMIITADIGDEGEEAFDLVQQVSSVAEQYYGNDYYLAGSGPTNYDLKNTITEDMLKVNLIAVGAVYLVLLLMMRSFLLPALLVISIETAIWINLSFPYFTDSMVFYIAYLIISTVQLGATVDYAILMTDRYRECRQTLNKREAVVETVASSTQSILVSGLVLTIVGFLLGYISSNGVLAQLGIFVGRGALCSLTIVFFVLPGLLYLFDKLYINRGKGKMNKKKITAAVTACLMLGTVMMPAATYAADGAKEEVIYGNLNHDGSVSKVYAVNIFDDKTITDHGDYSEVTNLTSTDKISVEGDEITVEASETPFYYEGVLEDQELPWEIDIQYSLDGKKCDAQGLAGKSGALEIAMSIKEGANAFFFENYALQITMTMDSNYCRNIQAEGATIANVGSNKQITYTVLPGKGADITVTADVTAFEMAEININGIKLNMDVDVDTSEMESKAAELEDGSKMLDDGAAELKDGADQLDQGAEQLQTGADTLDEAAGTLQAGASELADGAANLEAGVDELADGAAGLGSGAGELASGSAELFAGIQTMAGSISGQAYKSLMKENGLDLDQLIQGNQQAAEQLTALMQQASPQQQALFQQIISLVQGSNAAISGAISYLDGINSQIGTLETGAEALKTGAEQLQTGLGALSQGAAQLETGAANLTAGTTSLADGTSDLQEGTSALADGTSDLKTGTKDLVSGVTELKNGTGELKEGTSGIGDQITDEIDAVKEGITGTDEVRSFVSEKNTNVSLVQFVLKTEAIEVEDESQTVELKEEEKGFFEKLMDLFK